MHLNALAKLFGCHGRAADNADSEQENTFNRLETATTVCDMLETWTSSPRRSAGTFCFGRRKNRCLFLVLTPGAR